MKRVQPVIVVCFVANRAPIIANRARKKGTSGGLGVDGGYEEYYGQTYKDHWDKHVTPGKDGRAPLPEEHMEPHASEEQADEVQQQH